MVIQAKLLRGKALENVPDNHPGWYRWWAQETEVKVLLDSQFLTHKYFDELAAKLYQGSGSLQDYYYIYTGVAVKESIRARLNWHINQRHTESAVKHGTLSTLRQTLSSLVAGDQYNESVTNDFIDKLMVEYFPVKYQIKSPEAKAFLKKNEDNEMNEYVLVLNIKSNNHTEVKDLKKDLSQLRSGSKKKKENG